MVPDIVFSNLSVWMKNIYLNFAKVPSHIPSLFILEHLYSIYVIYKFTLSFHNGTIHNYVRLYNLRYNYLNFICLDDLIRYKINLHSSIMYFLIGMKKDDQNTNKFVSEKFLKWSNDQTYLWFKKQNDYILWRLKCNFPFTQLQCFLTIGKGRLRHPDRRPALQW